MPHEKFTELVALETRICCLDAFDISVLANCCVSLTRYATTFRSRNELSEPGSGWDIIELMKLTSNKKPLFYFSVECNLHTIEYIINMIFLIYKYDIFDIIFLEVKLLYLEVYL